MIRIKVCLCCGSPYEIDDVDDDLTVCNDCNEPDPDMIGIVEFDFTEWSED
jgi:hypothetical protein